MEDKLKEKILTSYKYNPETGDIVGPSGNPNRRQDRYGYLEVCVTVEKEKKYVRGHRMAWLLYYGYLPKNKIDHVDGNKLNNKINNLREVSQRDNTCNSRAHRAGKLVGSCKLNTGKYSSTIMVNRKKVHLGTYNSEIEAHNAYMQYRAKHNL